MVALNKLKKYGNWALISGASSGVGKAFATLFIKNHINCVLVSEDQSELEHTKQALETIDTNIRVELIKCDLSNPLDVDNLLRNELVNRCTLIINCAGIGIVGYFIQHTHEEYLRMLEINAISLIHITHHFCLKFYMQNQRGAIINVGSANAELHSGAPFSAIYSAEKSLIKYATEAIAFEMSPLGIDLLCVSCGPVETAFQKKAGTHTLSWCETPENVAIKSIYALGKKASIITNPWTVWIIRLNNLLWLPYRTRMKLIAWFFGGVLSKKENVNLPKRPHTHE